MISPNASFFKGASPGGTSGSPDGGPDGGRGGIAGGLGLSRTIALDSAGALVCALFNIAVDSSEPI